MPRYNLNARRRKDGFERFTFSDPQQVKAPMLNEYGELVDRMSTAGPGVLDYSAVLGSMGVVDGTTTGNADTFAWYVGQREFTWVICDGRLMGPHETNDFPIGADSAEMVTQWEDCEYAVISNLECEIVLARPTAYHCQTYTAQLVETTTQGTGGAAFVMPNSSTLAGYLDTLIQSPVELEGGDVWATYAEMFKAPYIVTLMRCELSESTEESTVDMQPNTTNPRQGYSLAPLSMLIRDEHDDPADFITNGEPVGAFLSYNPRAWLEGTSQFHTDGTPLPDMDALRECQYRAWNPMDNAEGIFLERYMDVIDMFLPNGHDAQDVQKVDIEGTEGYEPSGYNQYPGMANARLHTMRVKFAGDIVVSMRDPRPLVLHIAGAPVRLNSGTVESTGDVIHSFYRPTVIPVRWSIKGNLKVR